jgi:Zn-dependent peptidase ImmA (M78 family)
MDQLLQLADELGIKVVERRGGKLGGYHAGTTSIRLHPGMSRRHARSVLAHEIAHHVFGDEPSIYGPLRAKQERRANEWAALRLITTTAYAESEAQRHGHLPAMAHDLGVTLELIEAYKRLLTRLGDATYVAPKMGAGQFADRAEVA